MAKDVWVEFQGLLKRSRHADDPNIPQWLLGQGHFTWITPVASQPHKSIEISLPRGRIKNFILSLHIYKGVGQSRPRSNLAHMHELTKKPFIS